MTDWVMVIVALIALLAMTGLVIVVLRRLPAGDSGRDGDGLPELILQMANRDGVLESKVTQVDGRLSELQKDVAGREAALDKQVAALDTRMQGITTLFTQDRARGSWGEVSLLRILELAGMSEGRDFTPQFDTGEGMPDVVVHLPGGSQIVIDAKFPIARYMEAMAADSAEEKSRLLREQGKEIARVGRALAGRGYSDVATGAFIIMYLPSQGVYELASEAHPEVIELLMAERVILAGPSSLFALLAAAGALLAQHRALQDADRILEDVRELTGRLSTWLGHLEKIGTGLSGATKAFNQAVGSWTSRVSPHVARISESAGQQQPTPPNPVDEVPREVKADGLRAVG